MIHVGFLKTLVHFFHPQPHCWHRCFCACCLWPILILFALVSIAASTFSVLFHPRCPASLHRFVPHLLPSTSPPTISSPLASTLPSLLLRARSWYSSMASRMPPSSKPRCRASSPANLKMRKKLPSEIDKIGIREWWDRIFIDSTNIWPQARSWWDG